MKRVRSVAGGVVLLGLCLCAGMLPEPGWAEEASDPSVWLPETLALSTPVDPVALEASIQVLADPVDQEQLSQVLFELARVEDIGMQQRLQQLLEERLTQLFNSPDQAGTHQAEHLGSVGQVTPEQPADPGFEAEVLRLEIATLRLDPDAAVEDLRRRDEVVARITRVSDPNVRYELLELLDEQERVAQNVPAAPPYAEAVQ